MLHKATAGMEAQGKDGELFDDNPPSGVSMEVCQCQDVLAVHRDVRARVYSRDAVLEWNG
jgi:hypothetical protein